MRPRARSSRAGVALLLVLVTFTIAVTACVSLAQLAHSARMRSQLNRLDLEAQQLVEESHKPILLWLTEQSEEVVLPANALTPEVAVLDDTWQYLGKSYRLTITAWDQYGMVPFLQAIGTTGTWHSIPGEVLSAVGHVDHAGAYQPGLDLFEPERGHGAFPKPTEDSPTIFGDGPSSLPQRPQGLETLTSRAPGAWVATHNPGRGFVNVNTAPLPLLQAAMRAAGRGGVEQIVTARREGRRTTLGGVATVPDPQSTAPQLTGLSRSWAFRVDARVGRIQRSWWFVYRSDGENWNLAQRLPIGR